MNKNELAMNYLKGNGVELGALHNPMVTNKELSNVVYADKLPREEAIIAFPELESVENDIVETDLIVDLDQDSLTFLAEREFDFVIANHVIEHLVNPIIFLEKLNANMKAGALLFLTVPNKDYTHDVNRKLTRYSHLRIERFLKTKRLSNSHVRDYLKNKLPVENVHPQTVKYFEKHGLPLSYYNGNKIPLNPLKRRKLFGYQRSRSIHVHVWNRETFDFFLRRSIDLYSLKFSIVEYLPAESSPGEMIYLLKKES